MIPFSLLFLNFISMDICRGLPGTARMTGDGSVASPSCLKKTAPFPSSVIPDVRDG
jgi:hypothetical protein